jgi:hypothetical protein
MPRQTISIVLTKQDVERIIAQFALGGAVVLRGEAQPSTQEGSCDLAARNLWFWDETKPGAPVTPLDGFYDTTLWDSVGFKLPGV